MRSLSALSSQCPLFLALSLVACIAASAFVDAGARCIPFDPGYVSTDGGQVLIVPDGSGPALEAIGATITVQLWACPGEPNGLANYPAQDMWLDNEGPGTLAFCAPGAIADGPTNADGMATFSGALAGGGTANGSVVLHIGGIGFALPSFEFVSPDIDGDLDVDLGDFTQFGLDYSGTAARSDFDFDGRVGLLDFLILGQAFGAECP